MNRRARPAESANREKWKRDPDPPRILEIWRYSHPAISRRIDFALNYKPWESGEPDELWTQ